MVGKTIDGEQGVVLPVRVGPLDFSGKFAGGIRNDIARRSKLYLSDYSDAFRSFDRTTKTLSTTMFLFFACLSPAIAFGLLFQEGTGSAFGVVEMITSSGIAGILWALFSGQPLCILGATGPVLAYTVVCFNLFAAMQLPFLPMYWWTGAWFSLFTILFAASDFCCVVKHVTKFTEEIFSMLISLIFIVEAFKPVIKNFHSTYPEDYHKVAYQGMRKWSDASAFVQFGLMFFTWMLATKLAGLKNTNWASPLFRKMIGSFGVTISILFWTAMAAIWCHPGCKSDMEKMGQCIHIDFLNVPSGFSTTFKHFGQGESRAWLQNPFEGTLHDGTTGLGIKSASLPIWAIFFAILPAAGFAVLGFLDQNLTTLLVNRKSNNLKKPPAYHLDMFVCGFLVYPICTVLCLPFPVAATVRSLTHLIALTTYETVEIEGGGQRKVPVDVVEQRVTNLGIHLLIILCVFLASILKFVPKPVLLGVFLFMGVSSLNGNELWERVQLYFIWDSSKFPKYPYVKSVRTAKIHLFTFFQFTCLAILYALKSIKAVAVVFPFFIASLVLIRFSFKCFFSEEELHALDGHDEGDEVAIEDPNSPLKRTQGVSDELPVMITNKEKESGFSPVGSKSSPGDLPVILGAQSPSRSDKGGANDDVTEAV